MRFLPPCLQSGSAEGDGARDGLARDVEIWIELGAVQTEPAVRYFVAAPRSVEVEERKDEKTIIVDDAGGARTVIRLFGLPHSKSPGSASAQAGPPPRGEAAPTSAESRHAATDGAPHVTSESGG